MPFSLASRSCISAASVTSVQQRTSRQLSCPLQESLRKDETRPREPAGSAQHPWETGVLDIAHCHSELAVRWRAGWLGQHSRVFAGSVHSQLAMSRTPVSQACSGQGSWRDVRCCTLVTLAAEMQDRDARLNGIICGAATVMACAVRPSRDTQPEKNVAFICATRALPRLFKRPFRVAGRHRAVRGGCPGASEVGGIQCQSVPLSKAMPRLVATLPVPISVSNT